tara:strand:- start:1595 stop:2770 length:1176 start_codon:yes stop_codon:yes gene_type:complete
MWKNLQTWTNDALTDMGHKEKSLNNLDNAYTYFILAKDISNVKQILRDIPCTSLEAEYDKYIHPDVRILRFKGLRGVFATNDIKEGTVVFSIPRKECLNGTKEELVERLKEDTAYTRSMPDTKFPVMWSEKERDDISVSPLRLELEKKINSIDNLKLRSLVGSRCFADKEVDYLVPFADMMNHSNNNNIEWFFTKDEFVMKTSKDVAAHTELFDCYGIKSNYETFLHYGFVEKNPWNVIRMIATLPPKIYKHRVNPNYFQESFEFELNGQYNGGTVEIFSFLRYIRSNDPRCPTSLQGYFRKPISRENEVWVCKMLYNILKNEVRRRVEKTAYGIEAPLAVSLLQSEMEVLVHWGETLTTAIRVMEQSDRKSLKNTKNVYLQMIRNLKFYN